VRVDRLFQHGKRDAAGQHKRVVEAPEIVAGAERGAGLFAQAQDLAMAEFVAAGLAGQAQ
jgi:hypothetical protein